MSFSFCDKINSGDNMFENIKAMLDKENGAISLIKQSKTGKMNLYGKERLSAKLYVYEAFKPILDANNISKKDYLANLKQEQSMREAYLKIMSNYLKGKESYQQFLPELYESGQGVNVDAFTRLLQNINEQWLQMQKDIKENTAEPEIMQELKDKISYSVFAKGTPEQRSRLLQIARDRNRTEDKKVYQQLEPYIEAKEDVTREEYLDSPELRGKYRKEYQKLRQQLEEKPILPVATPEENISYTVNNWFLIASNKRLVSEESRSQFISQYSITDFAHLSMQETRELYNQSNQEINDKIRKDQEATRRSLESMQASHRQSQATMNQIYNDFFADQVIETEKAYQEMLEMEGMLSNSTDEKGASSSNSAPKK